MGETRSFTNSHGNDNASATSEDSLKPSLRHHEQFNKTKVGSEALPADAFDPLMHKDIFVFWEQIEVYFQPINQGHLKEFSSIPINSGNGSLDRDIQLPFLEDIADSGSASAAGSATTRDRKREAKRESHPLHFHSSSHRIGSLPGGPNSSKVKQESVVNSYNSETHKANNDNSNNYQRGQDEQNNSNVYNTLQTADLETRASLNSFPYTQRLMSALLDVNPNGTSIPTLGHNRSSSSSRNGSGSALDAHLWIGVGNEEEVRKYQNAVETRVKNELSDRGWLDDDEAASDLLDAEIRKEQTKLRDLKSLNRLRQFAIHGKVDQELKLQAERRIAKRRNDQTERDYLEQMVNKMKKNKKSRAKFQRLLSKMFGHYKEKEKMTEKNKKLAAAAAASAAAAMDTDTVSVGGGGASSAVGGSSTGGIFTGGSGGEEKVRSGKKKKNKKGGSSSNNNDLPTKSTAKGLTRKSMM